MKRLLTFAMAIIFAMQLFAQQDSVSIGTGATTTSIGPVPGYYGNHRAVQLYSSWELNMPQGGVIEAISFELGTVSGTESNRQVRIYMKEVADTTLPTSMTINELANDAFLVYTSPESGEACVSNEWYRFELQTPFVYSGVGSLYVFLEGDGCTASGGCGVNVKYTAGTGKGWVKCWDTTTPSLTTPIANTNTHRTNTRFFYTGIPEDYCYPIADLLLTTSTESVDLTWTSDNTNFEIQYKLESETWESENVVTVYSTTTSATIDELLPATFYDVRVKSICGEEESIWMTTSFRTDCDVIDEFPWIETFETAWIEPYLPGTISAPNCWINMNADGSTSYYIKPATAYEGQGVYMYGYATSTSTSSSYTNKDWFITPVVELTGAEMLSFYAKKSSTSYTPELRIYALDLSVHNDVTSQADTANFVLIDSLLDLTTTYVEREVLLSELDGQYRLAFVRNRTIGHGAIYFDNVKVGTAPTCERVTDLTTTEITTNTISLSWEGSEGTSSYKIYYKMSSAAEWTIVEEVTDNYYTLTDLTSGTSYTINITAVCDNEVETGFITAGNLVVATLCDTYEVPFLEDFTIYPAGSLETCWREAQCTWDSVQAGASLYGYSNAWATNSSTTVLPDVHAKINNFSNTKRDWLITPNIDLGDGSIAYDFAFDIAYTDYGNANPVESYCSQRFGVIVSTDGGSTWDFENAILWTTTPTEGTNERNITDLTNLAQRIKINLSEVGYTGVVRIAFYAESLVSGCDNDIHIDNVAVQEHVDCGDMVGNPLVNPTSSTSVAMSWNAEEHEAATGWAISYTEGTTNEDPDNATIVEVPYGSEIPYAIEGLTEGATYTFRVQYDCGGAWSGETTVTLPESMDMFATIPYTNDFEDVEENANWIITNNSYDNRWHIGHPANVASEGNMLYVGDSTGVNSTYDNSSATSYVFASRLIQFEEALAYEISFDYYVQGESTYDFIKVGLRPWDESFVGITGAPSWTTASTVQEGFEYPSGVAKFNLDTTGARGSIIVDGLAYNNTLQQLVFAWRNDSGGGVMSPVLVDNISITPINCIAPDGFSLAEDGRQLTSLTFDIDTRSGDSWEIQYQEYSDTVWQSVFATDTVGIEVSNLTPGTMYRVRVRSICDQDTSFFTDELLWQTLCPIITVTDEEPFEEGFELATWFRSGSVTSPNAYAPLCWHNVDAGSTSYRWQSSTTEPYEGTNYAQLYLTTTAAVDWLITPIFDLAGTETLSFYAKHTLTNAALQSGVSIMYYSVDENGDMSSAADTALFVNLQDVNLTNEYAPYDVSLATLGAGQYRLAFLVSQTATTSHYIRIDNVKIANISCPRPTGEVVVSNVTPTSATVSWTDEGNTAWNVYFKAEEDSTYQMVASTETSVDLDLIPHTYYDVYVVASCGEEESEPTLTSTFMTPCDYVTELPYFEGFEELFVTEGMSNVAAPACWINYSGGYESTYSPSYFWKRTTTASCIHEGSGALYSAGASSSPGNEDWMVSPVISHEGGAIVRFFAKSSSATAPGITLRYLDVTTHGDVTGLADTANFVTIGTINATTTFAEFEYILTDLPETYRLAFVRQDVGSVSMYIDNFSIVEIPTCFRPDPASVTVSEITSNTATVSWTDSDENNTSWVVYYKPVGEEEYLSEPTTETTIELTDLVSGTAYEVYVVTVCSDNSESDATYTKSFYTLQEPTELPYTCDFESENESEWLIKNSTLVNKWYIGTPTGATSNSLYVSADNGATATYAHYSSVVVAEKLFQLGATDSVRISFDLTVGGEGSSDYLKVFWVPADTVFLPATSAYFANSSYGNGALMNNYVPSYSTSTTYYILRLVEGTQNMSVTLENNPNELRKLVFVWKNDGSGGNQQAAIIDNIMVEPVGEEITCTKPVATSVVASAVTESSATITWADNDETHTAWNVYYKAEGDEDYSMYSANETSFELAGLLDATSYSVYVTTDCGGGDESAPTDTIYFTTECYAVTDFPYTEGFNSQNVACWTTSPVSGTYNWNLSATYQGGITPVEGEYFVIYKTTTRTTSARLVSPMFDLTSLSNPHIKYSHIAKAWSSDQDELKVQYRTSPDEEWVDLVNYTTEFATWTLDSLALPNPSATYQIAFLATSDYGYGVGLDAIQVYDAEGEQGGTDPEPEPCDAPTALAASDITETTATITWNGTATSYEFKLNNGTAETLTATTKALTGLTANTAYTVEVRAICGEQQSEWVSTTFTTLAEQGGTDPEPCDAPTNLAASNITETSADITWNGTATTYEFRLNNGTAETLTATTKALTGLTANTAYTVEVRAICGEQQSAWVSTTFTTLEEEVEIIAPVVTTLAATAVDHESAVLNGTITAGNETITAQGFKYKAATATEWTEAPAIGTTLIISINGLTAETTYTFKAFATTASGTVEGAELTFTTLAIPVVVVEGEVTTSPATEVGNTSATLNGTLVSAGNSENFTVGFALSTTADFTLEDAGVQNVVATLNANTFSQSVNDLVEGQTYFFRAYITNEAGTTYGTVETFTLSGLNDAIANQINVVVYPNPASTQATMRIAGLQSDAKIVISDIQGRILSQEEISASTTTYTINLDNMASGVYYIRIVTDNVISTQKLIVE